MIFSGTDQDKGLERAQARIRRMSSNDLLDWLDVALSGMMRHLENYRRSGDFAHLAELGLAEMTVNMVMSELTDRSLAEEVSRLEERSRVTDYSDIKEVYAPSASFPHGVPS
jgi:hypothetical protein